MNAYRHSPKSTPNTRMVFVGSLLQKKDFQSTITVESGNGIIIIRIGVRCRRSLCSLRPTKTNLYHSLLQKPCYNLSHSVGAISESRQNLGAVRSRSSLLQFRNVALILISTINNSGMEINNVDILKQTW